MIAAMERALADDMDVLNMSIGSAFNTWPQYPTAAASDALVNAGVSVVASIGNSGANGLYSAGAPGVGRKVIGVASFDNVGIRLPYFTVTPANMTAGYNSASGAPARTDVGQPAADEANAVGTVPPGACPQTTAALPCRPGTYTGHGSPDSARNVRLLREGASTPSMGGASAVVLYNNVAGRINPTLRRPGQVDGQPVTIPVVAVSDTEGVAIHNAIVCRRPDAELAEWHAVVPERDGQPDLVVQLVRTGAELELKPDIGAPGGFIWSTVPDRAGLLWLEQRHVDGLAARGGRRGAAAGGTPRARRSRQSATSSRTAPTRSRGAGNPGLGFLDNVHRQGAGMLDIDDAILATTKITPGKLSLGESDAGPSHRTLTLTNTSGSAVTYNLCTRRRSGDRPEHVHAGVLHDGFAIGGVQPEWSSGHERARAGRRHDHRRRDDHDRAPPSSADKRLYGGYLVFTPQGGGQTTACRTPASRATTSRSRCSRRRPRLPVAGN